MSNPVQASASGKATTIIPFVAEHEAECAQLWMDALPDMFRAPPPATLAAFRESTKGESAFVAVLGGTVCGFVSVWDPDRFIHVLVSDSRRRRRGIGGALLEHAVAYLGRPVELKCELHNGSACAFYERRGWVPVERVTDAAQPYVRYRLT